MKNQTKTRRRLLIAIMLSIVLILGIIPIDTVSNISSVAGEEVALNEIQFGRYPQSLVTDEKLIKVLSSRLTGGGEQTIEYKTNKYLYEGGQYYKYDPITWLIVSGGDSRSFLMSKYVLNARSFGNVDTMDIEWKASQLRTWCNDDFFNTAFTEEQKKCMIEGEFYTCEGFVDNRNATNEYVTLPDHEMINELNNTIKQGIATDYLVRKESNSTKYSYFTRCTQSYYGVWHFPIWVTDDMGFSANDPANWSRGIRPCITLDIEAAKQINEETGTETDDFSDSETVVVPKAKSYEVNGSIYKDGKVYMTYDENDFSSSSMTYNHKMARFASALSLMAYTDNTKRKNLLEKKLEYKDIKEVPDKNGNTAPFTLAHKKVLLNGEETEILLVVIRGTYNEEWIDNFDSGTGETHVGFARAAKYVMDNVNKYIKASDNSFDKNAKLKVLLTGHSRGAAAANLIGKQIDNGNLNSSNYSAKDVFVYTFATPNVTKDNTINDPKYNNIYNVVNPEDFVTKVLPRQWGYGRYGITYSLPSKTTDTKEDGNYIDYTIRYKPNIEAIYNNDLKSIDEKGKRVYYTPYTLGTYTLDAYVTLVTTNVRNVSMYYIKDLFMGMIIPGLFEEHPNSLHHFYKYGLGGNQSKNTGYELRSIVVMRDALAGKYGLVGQQTLLYFIDNQVFKPQFATAHMCDTYYAGMRTLTKAELQQKRKSLLGIINCPVDVAVKDSDGKILGEIKDNKVDESYNDEIAMNVTGDSKTFAIPADSGYSVELTGNDEGIMDYSICEMDADSGETERVFYKEIPVHKDASMKQEISAETNLEDIDLVDAEGDTIEPASIINEDELGALQVNVEVEGIGFADSYTNLTPGDYVTLTAITDENNEFLGWYDKDEKLITKETEYGISVKENMSFTAKFTNNVVDVTDVSLSEKELKMKEDEYQYLEASVVPANATNKTIEYSSSDENVVIVDEGVLHAVGSGTATITAKSIDGEKTKTCKVVVTHSYDEGTITTQPTCTAKGVKTYKCTNCSATKTSEVAALGHNYSTTFTVDKKATLTAEGSKSHHCSRSGCTSKKDVTAIASPKTFTLAKTSYEYTGSQIKPGITIKDSKGATISSSNYTLTYGTNKAVGKGTVKVTFKGNYSGTKTLTFKIVPKKTTINTPVIASDGITVKWTKNTTGSGYYIYRSINGAEYKKVKTITSNATVSWKDTASKTNGYKYQYKIVAYKTIDDVTYSSAVSAVKNIYFLTRPTVSLANQASSVKVSWGKNAKATGYTVYKSTDAGKTYKTVKTITSNATVSYTDTAAKTNGTKYMYKVVANKKVGDVTYKSALSTAKVDYFVSRPTISGLTNTKGLKMLVKWAKNAKANGYQIQYSTSSGFSSPKSVTVSSASIVSKTISSLTKGKTYYVRMRTYKTVSSTRYYSAWSTGKNVKIAK